MDEEEFEEEIQSDFDEQLNSEWIGDVCSCCEECEAFGRLIKECQCNRCSNCQLCLENSSEPICADCNSHKSECTCLKMCACCPKCVSQENLFGACKHARCKTCSKCVRVCDDEICTGCGRHTDECVCTYIPKDRITIKNGEFQTKKNLRRAWRPWSREEVDTLRSMFATGASLENISEALSRSEYSVMSQLQRFKYLDYVDLSNAVVAAQKRFQANSKKVD